VKNRSSQFIAIHPRRFPAGNNPLRLWGCKCRHDRAFRLYISLEDDDVRLVSDTIRFPRRVEEWRLSRRALALRCNNRKVVTRPPPPSSSPSAPNLARSSRLSPLVLARAHTRAWGGAQPPWKNHGFTRQIAYAYKAVLFRALTHRRVYLTDIPTHPRCILCGVLYLLAAAAGPLLESSRFSTRKMRVGPFNPIRSHDDSPSSETSRADFPRNSRRMSTRMRGSDRTFRESTRDKSASNCHRLRSIRDSIGDKVDG